MAFHKEAVLMAGIGGMAPTICMIATAFGAGTAHENVSLQTLGALVLFFLIGSVWAYKSKETDIERAFHLGITAPALIAGLASGTAPTVSTTITTPPNIPEREKTSISAPAYK